MSDYGLWPNPTYGFQIEENKQVRRHAEKDGARGEAIDLLLTATKP